VELQLHSFLTLALEVTSQLHATLAFLSGKSPCYQLNRKLGGFLGWFEASGKEKKILPLLRIKP
jgi:hypothetical protein